MIHTLTAESCNTLAWRTSRRSCHANGAKRGPSGSAGSGEELGEQPLTLAWQGDVAGVLHMFAEGSDMTVLRLLKLTEWTSD